MYINPELENYLVSLHEYQLEELRQGYEGLTVLADRYATPESDIDTCIHVLCNIQDTVYTYSPCELRKAFRESIEQRCRAADPLVGAVDHDGFTAGVHDANLV